MLLVGAAGILIMLLFLRRSGGFWNHLVAIFVSVFAMGIVALILWMIKLYGSGGGRWTTAQAEAFFVPMFAAGASALVLGVLLALLLRVMRRRAGASA